MNPLKRWVTVGLLGVALVAAACGSGSSSSTSTTAKPPRGFVATISHVTLTCQVGAGGSGSVQLQSKIFGTPASAETPISCTSGQTSKVDIQPTSEPSAGYLYKIDLSPGPNVNQCSGSGMRPSGPITCPRQFGKRGPPPMGPLMTLTIS
jgi:hypothetical protein